MRCFEILIYLGENRLKLYGVPGQTEAQAIERLAAWLVASARCAVPFAVVSIREMAGVLEV